MSEKLLSDDLLGSVAKETGYLNKFTGEYMPFRTAYNSGNDKGVTCEGKDLCHTEEYVPIADVMRRYLRDGIPDISSEFAYGDDNLPDEDSAFDAFDNEDILDRQIDLEEYAAQHPENESSDSGAVKTAIETSKTNKEERAPEQANDDARGVDGIENGEA